MKIAVTQIKSRIGANKHQKAVLDALGLRKNYQTAQHNNTPAIQGMVAKVKHLVTVAEVK